MNYAKSTIFRRYALCAGIVLVVTTSLLTLKACIPGIVTPPKTVEDVIERIITTQDTSGQTGSWVAYVAKQPVSDSTLITPAEGTSTYAADGDFWFAFVDEDPFAQYEHEVKFIFIDADTGEMTVEDQLWWPQVNGTALFVAGLDLVRVYSSTVTEDDQDGTSSRIQSALQDTAPSADYGDAPDDTEAYENGSVGGMFPTLFATENSLDDRPGGHTLTIGEETLGKDVSAEVDANDPNDPDTVPNLVDQDKDDRFFWILYPDFTTNTLAVRFLVEVAVAVGAPNMDRFLNILTDHNRDGEWKKNSIGKEWLVENFVARVRPGTSEWIWTEPVNMPLDADNKFGFENWTRVALTRARIDGTLFGDDGWDGSGQFEHGEIEDHYVNFLPWYGDDDDDDDDDDNDDDNDDNDDNDDGEGKKLGPNQPPAGDPGEDAEKSTCEYICPTLMIQVPITCKTLIINFGDTPGNSWMQRNGQKAQGFFTKRFGDGSATFLNKPPADTALTAIKTFLASGKCLDELYLYIVGHGSRSGYIRAQNGGGKLTVKELNEAITTNTHCPSMMNYFADECTQPGYCNVNIIIQSCYSGTFLKGDNSVKLGGVNVLTSASDTKKSYGRGDGDGSYVSNAFWKAYENNQADAEPNGDGDGEVTPDEAMKWAKDNHGGKRSDPDTNPGADCDCRCDPSDDDSGTDNGTDDDSGIDDSDNETDDTDGGTDNETGLTWQDPENDLIYWYQAGTPAYVGHLDIIMYGIVPVQNGFDALITTATALPGEGDTGFHEYYASFDANPAAPNYMQPGPTYNADTAYIAQFLNGAWNMFLFQYFEGEGWASIPTTSTVDVNGAELVMHIDAGEAGIEIGSSSQQVYMATWYKDNDELDVGDETTTQGLQP